MQHPINVANLMTILLKAALENIVEIELYLQINILADKKLPKWLQNICNTRCV